MSNRITYREAKEILNAHFGTLAARAALSQVYLLTGGNKWIARNTVFEIGVKAQQELEVLYEQS